MTTQTAQTGGASPVDFETYGDYTGRPSKRPPAEQAGGALRTSASGEFVRPRNG